MKLEITRIDSSRSADRKTLIVSAFTAHGAEITLSISREEIVDLLDGAVSNSVITETDLAGVLSRIERGGRTVHRRSSR